MKYDAASYPFTSSDKIFFDTNIWLMLNPPAVSPNNRDVEKYSKTARNIKKASASVYLNSTVISEYINRFARIRIEHVKRDLNIQDELTFKDFREGYPAMFRRIASETANNVRGILRFPNIEISDCRFTLDLLQEHVDWFAGGETDWCDQIIAEECRDNGYSLLTNDKDFLGFDNLRVISHLSNVAC